MPATFELQGHRGARGLKPENTLPGFEAALDAGVSSIETDVRLTRDGVPVLFHEPRVTDQFCRRVGTGPPPYPCHRPLVSILPLAQMRTYRADCNPDAKRFMEQNASVTPLAALFASRCGIDPYTPPALADLLIFLDAYSGDLGMEAGKTSVQRERAAQVRIDLELKRVPFHPEVIGDAYTGSGPDLLERRIVETIRGAGFTNRTRVRCFDHRCVRALRELDPELDAAVLVAGTAPVSPVEMVLQANAQVYCPDYEFLDLTQVRLLQDAGIRVLPWTVNDSDAWVRLLDWGVDGITTDYPDRLALLLRTRGFEF